MANGDKSWSLANIIMVAMGGIIAALITGGFLQMNTKLSELRADIRTVSDCMTQMRSDITRIDTLQKQRLEREAREEYRRDRIK